MEIMSFSDVTILTASIIFFQDSITRPYPLTKVIEVIATDMIEFVHGLQAKEVQ